MPTISAFKIVKRGNRLKECEDDYHFVGSHIFAVSDGAGEAAFSREWSNVLVNRVVAQPPKEFTDSDIRAWFNALQPTLYQEWEEQVPPYDTLPWHGQHKFKRGSSATLLLMRITPTLYRAFAVGDSCLFHVREDKLLKAFPVSESDQFDTHPHLVHTKLGIPEPAEALHLIEAEYQPGDSFLLATDALSAWLLQEHENGRAPWSKILRIANESALAEMVTELRTAHLMRNDDVALLRVVTDPLPVGERSSESAMPAVEPLDSEESFPHNNDEAEYEDAEAVFPIAEEPSV
jgi:hypothetical protein